MNFTNEHIKMAQHAKTAEELLTIAKENGIDMTKEQAKEYFAELHKTGELTDDELGAVVGGKYEPDPLFKENDRVVFKSNGNVASGPAGQAPKIYVVQHVGNYINGQWHYYIVKEGEVYGSEWSEESLMLYNG